MRACWRLRSRLPNPVLRVDFDGSQATAQRPLILTEHHLSVKDVDTRDPLDDTKVDASKIKFRITNIPPGTLRSRPSDASDVWTEIPPSGTVGNQYQEFTLAQLQGKLVALLSNTGAATLTFDIQAADDGDGTPGSTPHLSDSDPYDDESDADPTSVSVSVVALETVVAGKEARINEDGGLTPDNDTLDAWLAADNSLRIFVELQKGKSGIVRPSAGVVQEHLSVGTHSVPNNKIAVSWDANDTHWRLSLRGTTSAKRADFQEVLDALRLQTVHSAQGSDRTISVQPDMSDMSVSISRAGYYLREVEVSASDPNPVMEVDFSKLQATSQLPLILTEEHISVYDPDTRDTNDLSKVDALRIKFRITNIPDGILKRRIDISSPWENIDKTPTTQYREFTLAQLQGKLVALFPDAAGTLTFDIQAADDGPHLSDSDPYDDESDADPTSVSVSVVALETVVAGKEARINEDGGLTPDNDTLDAWLAADNSLRIFVELQKGKSGIVRPSAGVVQEHLSVGTHSVPNNKIAVSWDSNDTHWRLSLRGTISARRADFQEVLDALRLQTVHSTQGSDRTILVQPDLPVSISRAGYYLREVEVSASDPNPILEIHLDEVRVDSRKRLVLTEEHILVYDPDTLDGDGNADASLIEFRGTGLIGGTLQSRPSDASDVWTEIPMDGTAPNRYQKFTLADLQGGKIAFLAGDGLEGGDGVKIAFGDSGCGRCERLGEPERLRPPHPQ